MIHRGRPDAGGGSFWRRTLFPAALLVVLLGVFCTIPMDDVSRLVTGQPATAQVERCAKEGKYNVCRGSWVFDDGGSGAGTISGVGGEDVGGTVDVFAVDDMATTSRLSWATTPALFGSIAVALFVGICWSRLRRRPTTGVSYPPRAGR
ncbi:hypothetical protein [Micromonospora sonneratiae]|uniref:Uncharacterized protein n=1 Tax=Micromonospora sonneratiae TaxID=1184706 RepID=A0ABW3YKH2_9ACTN